MTTRRELLLLSPWLGALAASSWSRSSATKEPEPEAHAVEPPPSLEFRTMTFEHTTMTRRPVVAIAAVPRDLPPGARLPLVVLLPGGVHTKQKPENGCWGWWSDFSLGQVETALRRGRLTSGDFQNLVKDDVVASFNADLAKTPYRGAVIVTPWVKNRQTNPVPNGATIPPFLRELVRRARAELPVLQTREATGLGGVSVGGLWTLYCGVQLGDLFGSLVAAQPFTEDLDRLLRKTFAARTEKQRIRVVTALGDRLRPMNVGLVKQLRKEGVEIELVEYAGYHNAAFPAGPGGLDTMLTFDRWLRPAANTPAPAPVSVAVSLPSTTPSSAPNGAPSTIASLAAPVPQPTPPRSRTFAWIAAGTIATAIGAAACVRSRRRAAVKAPAHEAAKETAKEEG